MRASLVPRSARIKAAAAPLQNGIPSPQAPTERRSGPRPQLREVCRLRRSIPYILYISFLFSIGKVIDKIFTTCTSHSLLSHRLKAPATLAICQSDPFLSAPDARRLSAAAVKSHRLMNHSHRPPGRLFLCPICKNRANKVCKKVGRKNLLRFAILVP